MLVPDRRSVALVNTTIHLPRCLENYLANAAKYGHAEQVSVIVVADRKTPPEAGGFLRDLGRRYPSRITYLDVAAQQKLLRRWPALDLTLRYNCIQRRNIGYLQAALDEADIIIAVDDDNFVTEEDYIGAHLEVGRETRVPVVSDVSGWWNVCQRLTCDPPRRFYHRGYPKSRQDWKQPLSEIRMETVRPVVNAGLWLKNPDVDATTNIEEPVNVVGMEPVAGEAVCALAKGTWCPFNSQNTAFDIKTLPAMYLVVMHDLYRGYRIGRLDDIWMSYFLRAIADQLSEGVLYGPPLVVQDRNPHNFTRDLAEELGGYILTEKIVEYLRSFRTSNATYFDAYLDLIYHLRDVTETDVALEPGDREYFRHMTLGMAAWHAVVADIWGSQPHARIVAPSVASQTTACFTSAS
jgi:hypothetical protein